MTIRLALCFVLTSSALAQEKASVAPPKFPLSLRSPQNSSWTISSAKKGETSASGEKVPFVQTLAVEKTLPIYHETATVTDGRSWEKWVVNSEIGDFQFIKYAGDSTWKRLSRSGANSEYSNYKQSDFEEFQWATEATYKGVTEIAKTPVYTFETNTNNGPLTDREAARYDYGPMVVAHLAGKSYGTNLTVSADVDAQTLLPMKFDNGTEVHTYSFGPAPVSHLTPPPEVLADLRKWLQEIKAATR